MRSNGSEMVRRIKEALAKADARKNLSAREQSTGKVNSSPYSQTQETAPPQAAQTRRPFDAGEAEAWQFPMGRYSELTAEQTCSKRFPTAYQRCRMTKPRMMLIGEMSQLFNVSLRTLRFYEQIGLLFPERVGNTRFYSPAEQIRVELIGKGKRFGFSLTEIKRLVCSYHAAAVDFALTQTETETPIENLKRKREQIVLAISDLQQALASSDATMRLSPEQPAESAQVQGGRSTFREASRRPPPSSTTRIDPEEVVELAIYGRWERVAIEEAVGSAHPTRCPKCFKPIKVHRAASGLAKPSIEHAEGSFACSLTYRRRKS